MPNIHYTDHARRRMAERGITEDDVRWALRRRIGDPEPGQPGTVWIRGHGSSDRVLRVCVETADHTRVVTVAWA